MMTATYHHYNTPEASKGRYAIRREWPGDSDYLHAWDDEWGAVFTSVARAMTFDNKNDAVLAAIRAKQLVPNLTDGCGLVYDAVLLA